MCSSIDEASLPKTFKDAIKLTRQCGVRHLWIDSLCIIQDSITDWAAESSTMGDVYQNSVCNISAMEENNGPLIIETGKFLEPPTLLV